MGEIVAFVSATKCGSDCK